MSVNFMIQAIKSIHYAEIDDDDLEMIYTFILNLDNEEINDYFNTHTVVSYDNDLELCVEIITSLIGLYEITEKFEKCNDLLIKKNKIISILKTKKYV